MRGVATLSSSSTHSNAAPWDTEQIGTGYLQVCVSRIPLMRDANVDIILDLQNLDPTPHWNSLWDSMAFRVPGFMQGLYGALATEPTFQGRQGMPSLQHYHV